MMPVSQAGGHDMGEQSGVARRSSRDIEEHLRGASDAILLLLTEVGQLERHKRRIPPGEDRFDEIARALRVAAEALAEFTKEEEDWAAVATADRTDLETISDSDNSASLSAILERWRAVERQLDDIEPGTPEATRLFAEFERIRDEYMTMFEARRASLPDAEEID
jgi:uncharacterized membrane protein YccC